MGNRVSENSKGTCFVVMICNNTSWPAEVETLCSCISKATEYTPELNLKAEAAYQKSHTIIQCSFLNALCQHSIR